MQASTARLLVPAVRYLLQTLAAVEPSDLRRRTPCSAWNLAMLLEHVDESLDAIYEGVATGGVDVGGAVDLADVARPLSLRCRARALSLLCKLATSDPASQAVVIGDRVLPYGHFVAVGAIEAAVHGWDIAQACGAPAPIPRALATDILRLVPVVVTDDMRPVAFASAVPVVGTASATDKLVASLGRRPADSY